MGIAFSCPMCGKGYNVADALAGRQARCNGCGSAVWVPYPTPPAAPPTPEAWVGSVVQAERGRKSGEQFTFEYADVLDKYLPFALAGIGFGLPAVYALASFSGPRVMGFLIATVATVGLALVGVLVAAGTMKFDLPENPFYRIAAVLAVPTLLRYGIGIPRGISPFGAYGVWQAYLPIGWFVGLVPAFLVFWFLFRLKDKEALVGFAAAIVAATIGSALAAGAVQLMFGRTVGLPPAAAASVVDPAMAGYGRGPAAVLASAALARPSDPGDAEARVLLAKVQRAYDALGSLELAGDYREDTTPPNQPTVTKTRPFTAAFVAPNRFRLEYGGELANVVVPPRGSPPDAKPTVVPGALRPYSNSTATGGCNGRYFYQFATFSPYGMWPAPARRVRKDDAVYIAGSHCLEGLRKYNPALLLAMSGDGLEMLTRRLPKARRLADVPLGGRAYQAVELTGDHEDPVALLIDPQTSLIRRATSTFNQPDGQFVLVRTVDYTAVRPNAPVAAGRLDWSPPANGKPSPNGSSPGSPF